MEYPVILYDGRCGLCHWSVRFVLRREKAEVFRFAALQGEVGQALVQRHGLPDDLSSLILIADGQAWRESSAALRICRWLRWGWPLLSVFLVVPGWLRNPVYRWVSRNRYRWFGELPSCPIPDPAKAHRFLDQAAESSLPG